MKSCIYIYHINTAVTSLYYHYENFNTKFFSYPPRFYLNKFVIFRIVRILLFFNYQIIVYDPFKFINYDKRIFDTYFCFLILLS